MTDVLEQARKASEKYKTKAEIIEEPAPRGTPMSIKTAERMDESPAEDSKESPNGLIAKVAAAKHMGESYVETTKEVFDFFMKNNKNVSPYFWMEGIRVYKFGEREAIERDEAKIVP